MTSPRKFAAWLVAATLLASAASGETWRFDRLTRVGGRVPRIEGQPQLIATPGKAVAFDGIDDALFIDRHPLAGARTFTFEAIFRPDGGAFEQRWFHLAQAPPPGAPADALRSAPRIMFEIRVVADRWYLDTFITGPGYNQTLVSPAKTHAVGRWYHVAQVFDGTMYHSYVDGILQGEAAVAYQPQGPGLASVGTRINRVNYFRGAVHEARFTRRALTPDRFLKTPARLRGG